MSVGSISRGSQKGLPNIAVEPTPTAYARPSLRLLARLTAGVGLQKSEE